jgi:AraC-like DNA-binding protein/ligand-binding sensor protein
MDKYADLIQYYSMRERLSFLLSPEVSRLFNHFTGLFDVRIAFHTPDGRELAVGQDRPWCEYCRLLRFELGDEDLCMKTDRDGRDRAMTERNLVHYTCHGGLVEAIKPMYSTDELIGFVMMGQVRGGAPLPAGKVQRWFSSFGDDRLSQAWSSVPGITKARMDHLLPLFSSLVDLILAKHMVSILGRHPLDPVLAHMIDHPEEHLSLDDVADLVGRSPDRTAHLFGEAYGRSFKTLQREIRMNRAVELLSKARNLGMKELAARCGFEDPQYFSRVFKAHFGLPPSRFRKHAG